jgi:PAS domain S-box-containing protein
MNDTIADLICAHLSRRNRLWVLFRRVAARSHGSLLLILPAIIGSATLLEVCSEKPAGVERTLRIGFQDSRPYQFPDASNNPSGPAVEIIREAASRQNIHLLWILSPQGPEAALSSGQVDLWALVGNLPERRRFMYISAPWTKMTYVLLADQSLQLHRPEDLGKNSLAVARINLDSRLAKEHFRNATVVAEPNMEQVMQAVCAGRAQAGLISKSSFGAAGISRCQERQLDVIRIPNATFWFGVGANKQSRDARYAADLLSDEIGKMARDGSLLNIDLRWLTNLSDATNVIFDYREIRSSASKLSVALAVVVLLLFTMLYLIYRLRRTRRELALHHERLEEQVVVRTAELHQAKAYVDDILQSMADSLLVVDRNGKIQTANPAACALLGHGDGALSGEFVETIMPRLKPLHSLPGIDEGTSIGVETEFITREGISIPVLASVALMRARGDMTIIVAQDLRELKRVQRELLQAKEAAEAANRAKSTFLANMSHEIRTPLNAVLGYSQLMLRDPGLGAAAKENLHIINRSGEHLLTLINDILDMSRIEAGKTTLDPVPFDLHDLLADLDAMFRLRAQAKGLQFAVRMAPECERCIEADKGKLRQILINLTGNAVKFTETGSVTLRALTRRNEDGQMTLAMAVEDSGPGIAAVEQIQLFRPFSQSASGRNLYGGTGLGLAISQEFVRLMGGEIGLSSELGVGSTFYFEIPVQSARTAYLDGEKPRRRVLGLQPGEEIRVLVTDDEPHNRGWLTELLTIVGFLVKEAPDGDVALALWREWKPQLILMDMRMPVMDGMEATRRIRAEAGGQEVVILALSAHAMEDKRREAMSSGVNDFITKPCAEGELLRKMQKYLGLNYLYAEDDEQDSAPPAAAHTSDLELSCHLPADIVAELRRAVESGEKQYLDRLIEKVGEIDGKSARLLKQLADNYEYDAMNELFREMPSEAAA